jgi:hypothetical protein
LHCAKPFFEAVEEKIVESSFYEGPLRFLADEKWLICDEPEDEVQQPAEDITMEDFYAVPHQSEFLEHGILSSVPIDFGEIIWRKKLREMTLAYYRMNLALEMGLRTGRVRFGEMDSVLSPQERKAVRNWVQNRKTGPIPLRVTITGRQNHGLLMTKEYGPLPMLDISEVPNGLKTACIYRFDTAKGKFFRLGLRRRDLKASSEGQAKSNGDECKPSEEKFEQSPRQVVDNLEDSTIWEDL